MVFFDVVPSWQINRLTLTHRLLRAPWWLPASSLTLPLPFHTLYLSLFNFCLWFSEVFLLFLFLFSLVFHLCSFHSSSHCSDHLLLLTFSSVAKHIFEKQVVHNLNKLLNRFLHNVFPFFELNILPLALTAVLPPYLVSSVFFHNRSPFCSSFLHQSW